jgi:PTH1 family peptidyl-tRNA hydrolase
MKIIIGLGNPGKKYEKTRHNFGFMAADFLRAGFEAPAWKLNKKFNAEISKITVDGEEIVLAKPQTFMNSSGVAIQKILSFYKATPADLIVMHDDMDIEFGKIKNGVNRGAAGHNGVQSTIDMLGGNAFARIRLGVGRPPENIPSPDYVLQKFSPAELSQIPDILKKISL